MTVGFPNYRPGSDSACLYRNFLSFSLKGFMWSNRAGCLGDFTGFFRDVSVFFLRALHGVLQGFFVVCNMRLVGFQKGPL